MIKEKKRSSMFNEFQQEIIGAIAIAVIVIVYFMLKRSAIPQVPKDQTGKNDTPIMVTQEETDAASETKEELPLKASSHKKEAEEELGDIEPAGNNTTNRRKSDKIIQKRSVPADIKITKQNFSEFAGERILVAEDNIINQKVLLGLLAESGIELIMANDGQEALDILENDTNFVMILMDAHMPRVDGFQAAQTIRANPKYDHILIVALSGDIATDDIQKMKDAGMSEQLAKPLRMESLYKIIYAYTGEKTNTDENTVAVEIENLDINKGLQTCGEDENFYREILSEFMSDYGNSPDVLGELLRSGNIRGADKYLLDIIGIAKNIGAHPLSEIASNMKLALDDTSEQGYYSFFDQYKIHFERLMEDITEYLR
jgi:CheY-like chemotaxis protein